MRNTSRSLSVFITLALGAVGLAGCGENGVEGSSVQQAVAQGAQGALGARVAPAPTPTRVQPTVVQPSVPTTPEVATGASEVVPEGRQATGGGLQFAEDGAHEEIAQQPSATSTALTWTGRSHGAVYFGRVDRQGHALGRATILHAVADAEEELVGSPSVVSVPGGYGVAWVDGDNGRVRFRRLDADGNPVGRASIVHEGLESPEHVQLAWNGREFAVAVQLWHGVYFARVSREGQRVGDGSVVAEGESVRRVEALRWEASGWHVEYAVERNGATERAHERFASRGMTARAEGTSRVM